MCSGGGGGGGAPAPTPAAAPPAPASAAPLTAPDIPRPLGGDDPNAPGYRGFTTRTGIRTARKRPVSDGGGTLGAGSTDGGAEASTGGSGTGIKM